MNQQDALEYARKYLYSDCGMMDWNTNKKLRFEDHALDRGLQYMLCRAVHRITEEFGEVTKKDIALLVEAWIMAQGNDAEHPMPLRLSSDPERMSRRL